MSEKPVRPGDREWRRKKSLQRRVLQHLKRHGSKRYDNLYMLFDPHRTGDTGLALQALKRRNYVEMGPDRVVKITESGLRLLEERL
jgi:hypothetical protein